MNHHRFRRALHRATTRLHESGDITTEQADMMLDALVSPIRHDGKGNACDLIERAHAECLRTMRAEKTLPRGTIFSAGEEDFDWCQRAEDGTHPIIDWLRNHWPQILSVIASLLTIFAFL